MTEDTRRAIEAIKPMAEVLGINVEADESILYCNGQAIGIGCNSTWATCLEFVGYAFLKIWCDKSRGLKLPNKVSEEIKDYWISKSALERIMQRRKAEGSE